MDDIMSASAKSSDSQMVSVNNIFGDSIAWLWAKEEQVQQVQSIILLLSFFFYVRKGSVSLNAL